METGNIGKLNFGILPHEKEISTTLLEFNLTDEIWQLFLTSDPGSF